jgi:hypothetical protein
VIVGACSFDNGQTDEGRAYVYNGSVTGLSVTPDWTAESDQALAQYGNWVSVAGDVNGDGYSDVIVGARYYDNGQSDEGRAYVYHGSATGLSVTPDWTAESDQALAYFGWSVSVAGDVNGDGYSDVIVGAPWYDNGQSDEGCAYVYHGSVTGLSTTPEWTAESDLADAAFGYSVSAAGDVNGDGYSDVIVGAVYYSNGQTEEGCAYVYHGGETGVNESPLSIPYSGLRLSVVYESGGMKFVCNTPAGMGDGDIVVYNLLGAEVDRVDMSLREAGKYSFEWSGQDNKGNTLPSGVYFARVIAGDVISNTVKFVLIQ